MCKNPTDARTESYLLQHNQDPCDATSHPGFFLKGQGSKIKAVSRLRSFELEPTTHQKDRRHTAAISVLQPSRTVNTSNVSHDVMMQQLGNKMLARTRDQTNKPLSPSRPDKLYRTHVDTQTETF